MGLGFALFENRILDRNTAHMVNPNMEWYLLPGMSDVPRSTSRSSISPTAASSASASRRSISTAAAVANAVANAIGVRVRTLPLTPETILSALERGARRRHAVKAFAYVNAANEKEAVAALGPERGTRAAARRRHGPARR